VAVFRIAGGKIEEVHAFTTALPFGMTPHRSLALRPVPR